MLSSRRLFTSVGLAAAAVGLGACATGGKATELRGSAALGALRQSLKLYDSLPKSVDVNNPPKDPVVHQASQATKPQALAA